MVAGAIRVDAPDLSAASGDYGEVVKMVCRELALGET